MNKIICYIEKAHYFDMKSISQIYTPITVYHLDEGLRSSKNAKMKSFFCPLSRNTKQNYHLFKQMYPMQMITCGHCLENSTYIKKYISTNAPEI